MILKGIFTLLTIFYLQNAVISDSQQVLFETTDINSIKKFIDENYNASRSNFSVFENLTWDEKNKTAGDFYLKMTTLIEKLSKMKSSDEGSALYWWDNVVVKELKANVVSVKNPIDMFYLNGQLNNVRKAIEYDVRRLSSLSLTFAPNTRNANYCMHAWALNWYSINHPNFESELRESYIHMGQFGNIREVFYDLLLHLSREEKTENNRYDYCKRFSSFHQRLYNLYRQVVVESFQEFSVRYFASMGEAICDSQVDMWILKEMEENLFNSLKTIMESTKEVLYNMTYYMFPCDPTYHENMDEETNLELEKMVQTVIIAEEDLSTTHSCSHNCNTNLIKDTLNKKECDEFLDCRYSTPGYQITELTNSSRRYGYFTGIDGEDKKQYGDPDRFFENLEYSSDVSSSYDWGSMRYCDYCICTCAIKPSRSPHVITAISLRDQVSDIENNMAISGAKFVKKDGMIHIQILEGEVLPHGQLGYEVWKPLEEFTYNESTKKFYVLKNNESQIPLEFGVDYARPHEMNLNNVMAPKKHAITGVRWRFAGDSLEFPKRKQGPIELQVRVTSLDFSRGKLINLDQSSWITPKEQVLKDELILENPDNPNYVSENTGWIFGNQEDPQYGQLKIHSTVTSNKFVKFRASDLIKDAGQSTVPFFDGRETIMYKSFLGGVGLVHRGLPDSGGHIAFKIFDFDMSPYFIINDDTSQTLLDSLLQARV
ncbi:uncharacterized protein LOC123258779 [Cotesia glomerata]|uniref:uncharacterized protein LOC123258779 n=1 Tax=Cotesia glomerata TaxID=32391 RepID=UPI001D01A0E6|nr:uncharacterized protein LOC123258779 [Cotesia glomerata]